MSERLPYEEQIALQWDDLPLPDEHMAWADMKRRLDEEDDRPLLPFWLRGCAGWGLLGLLLLGLGWWIIRPEKWFTKSHTPEKTVTNTQTGFQDRTQDDSAILLNDSGSIKSRNSTAANNETGQTSAQTLTDTITKATLKNTPVENHNSVKEKTGVSQFQMQETGGNKKHKVKPPATKSNKSRAAEKDNAETGITVQNGGSKKRIKKPEKNNKGDKEAIPQKELIPKAKLQPVPADSVNVTNTFQPGKEISTGMSINDTVAKKKIVSSPPVNDTTVLSPKKAAEPVPAKAKKDSSSKQPLEWSAGIGLQQLLPVSGQKWSPYNSQGRKNSLADYIPSVYVRLTRPQKWFLQAEFRYGAPQNTKELLYRQSKVNDTGSAPRFYYQTSSTLKKTYYHQLPLVFNYYVRQGWSVGAGIQWNNFYRAISEKEVIFHNNTTGTDTLLSKIVQPERRDTSSEFKKSFLQAVIESQYKWKRFSFGARYTFGLQPFIEFTLPGGALQNEKMNSLQLFIRFELWRQKKNNKQP